jgi:pyrimidine-nucleoside phosphorylase
MTTISAQQTSLPRLLSLHPVDLIRKKRDGLELTRDEIHFLVQGVAQQTIPEEQLAAWLMAVWLRGLSLAELDALTNAMRYSGITFDHSGLGRTTVDKHSTGGVGDKTSFVVAPIVAAAGLADPMISGRALGHTGGTLDKLESIPGYRTALSLDEAQAVLNQCGAIIIGQTKDLVPADRILYALRDRTATIESPYLLCASIMSKKLAADLNGLVLDVKTGSGAFLSREKDALFLAALMVDIGERARTRTVALLTDMNQPLGRFAGNWIEIQESVELLKNQRHPLSENLRELSLILAGWMIHLGGKANSAEEGRQLAEQLLISGAGLERFRKMIAAQGGDITLLDNPAAFHTPKFKRNFLATNSGYLARIDCNKVGWAVQRTGAGREQAGEPVEAQAGIEMHVKLGAKVRTGQPLCTLFAQEKSRLSEPEALLREAFLIQDQPVAPPKLIHNVITADNKNRFLERPSPHIG